VSQSNGIRALIITIDYISTTIEVGRGEGFSNLSKTLSKILSSQAFELMREDKKQGKCVPIFFAITKPRYGDKFDPKKMRTQLLFRVKGMLTNKEKQMKELEGVRTELDILCKEITDLKYCLSELTELPNTQNKSNQSGLSKAFFSFTGYNKVIETGSIEITVQNEAIKWSKYNIDVSEKLQALLRKILPLDPTERVAQFMKQKKDWKAEEKKSKKK